MPRNGSGVYSKPAGTTAVPNTTIESAKYNQLLDDIAADLNTARPIVAGGTGATSVTAAQTALSVDNKVVYSSKSADYTALATDNNGDMVFTAAATLSLTDAATLAANWHLSVKATNGNVVIDPNSSETINGATTLILKTGQAAYIRCTGTAFLADVSGDPLASPSTQGYLYGLTLSNNATDAVNDIDISVGACAADVSPYYLMQLTSGITKRVDATWTVGTGNGGMDTGSITTGTVHVWLIQRSDTGVVDVLFSASATGPTMPTNYDRKRRIGSIPRNGGINYGIYQIGDDFYHKGPPSDGSFADPGTSAILRTLTVPSGIVVTVSTNVFYDGASGASSALLITSPSQADQVPGTGSYTFFTAATGRVSGQVRCATNTSAQIRARLSLSNASTTYAFVTNGWTDTRGRV